MKYFITILTILSIGVLFLPSEINADSFDGIKAQLVGNSVIDLNWEEKDRILRAWTEFSNFNPSDGSFAMQIVQLETGKVVSDSSIQVMTNSEKSSINFNSFVLYMVNEQDICQNENYVPSTSTFQDCDPVTGEYEMQISTKDGSVESIPFSIVDSRVY